jgi:hypothetical protein
VQLHTPPGEFYRDSHVWEDQMLTPVIGVGSTSYHYLFQTVRALDQVSNESSSVRFINGITDSLHSRPDEIRDLDGEKDGLISYFTYEVKGKQFPDPWTDHNWSRRIRGDKRFLVLFTELGIAPKTSSRPLSAQSGPPLSSCFVCCFFKQLGKIITKSYFRSRRWLYWP